MTIRLLTATAALMLGLGLAGTASAQGMQPGMGGQMQQGGMSRGGMGMEQGGMERGGMRRGMRSDKKMMKKKMMRRNRAM